MARIPKALLDGTAHDRGRKVRQLDVQWGGVNGFSPNYSEHVSMTHYVSKDTVHLLVEPPKAFLMMPDPAYWISTLRSLIETHAMNWDGFQSGLTVETTQTPVGGAGEQFEDPSNVTRAKTDPTCTVRDMWGRPFQNFLEAYITYLIMDPDTKTPMISTIAGVKPGDWLADKYSFTMLSYETDPTHTQVAKAWLSTNMFPKTSGDHNGKRDRTSGGTNLDINIPWSAITQTGLGVVDFAQKLVDQINLTNANPGLRQSFVSALDADVSGNFAQGYKGVLEKIGTDNFIPS